MKYALNSSDVALLQAGLLDGEPAKAAFRQWRALVDFEGAHDGGQYRMLPLVYANMARLGLSDPVMARLKGVHRHAWSQGQMRQHAAVGVFRMLQTLKIPVMVSKGMALAQVFYPNPALRPMQDVDILVPRDKAETALEHLFKAGWSYGAITLPKHGIARDVWMARFPGIGLVNPAGWEVDLHWRPVHDCSHPFLDEEFWRTAEPLPCGPVTVRRPDATHLLLHVIAHGLRPNPLSPLRWVADAAMILRHSDHPIDWDRLWRTARRARLDMRLTMALGILSEAAQVALPPEAMRPGTASVVEWLESAAFRSEHDDQFTGWGRWALRVADLMRLLQGGHARLAPQAARIWVTQRYERLTQ